MASFDPHEKEDVDNSNKPEVTKYPMKRLEMSIKKFVKVLDIDLDRLYKHTTNISRLTNAEDWNGLHREQVNATRTIQQIKANIKEMEKARNQVNDDDLHLFDAKVQEVKSKALFAVAEFMSFVGMESYPQISDTGFCNELSVESGKGDFPHVVKDPSSRIQQKNTFPNSEGQSAFMYDSFEDEAIPQTPYGSLPIALTIIPAPLQNTSLHVVPQNSQASASWEQLQENIVELNELVHQFANNLEQQGEVISSIEDNIVTAQENVKQGTQQLVKAAKYKAVIFPVVGAVVGGALAGPVGLLAGMKIGGLATAVGGAVGFAGGRFVKRRQDKISDVEMKNLSDKRSYSLSDLPDTVKADNNTTKNDISKTEEQTLLGDHNKEADAAEETYVFSRVKRLFSFSEDKCQ